MSVRYRPNPAFEEEIRAQPQHEKGMRTITKGVANAVRAVAPERTGYYKRRVRAEGTKVRARDGSWHLVEMGSVNNPAYAPLRRGVLAAGLRFTRAPKPAAQHGPWLPRRRRGRRK